MKTYQSHLPDALHEALKAQLKFGEVRMTLSEGLELGALLVLVELGVIDSPEGAVSLGVGGKPAVVFSKILAGTYCTR